MSHGHVCTYVMYKYIYLYIYVYIHSNFLHYQCTQQFHMHTSTDMCVHTHSDIVCTHYVHSSSAQQLGTHYVCTHNVRSSSFVKSCCAHNVYIMCTAALHTLCAAHVMCSHYVLRRVSSQNAYVLSRVSTHYTLF